MHILEQYSLGCGARISKPKMITHYFPLLYDKYITIHNSKKFESRNYDFWEDVTRYLRGPLSKEGIKMVQVGGGDDPPINGVDERTLGKTSMKQSANIVKEALLHVGIDSFPVHVASAFDIPIVALYSNMHPNHSGPYWSAPEKVVCLESHRGGRKPSYSPNESEKSINMIYPEIIANSVLEKLGLEDRINETTKFIGDLYKSFMIELIPDFVINPEAFPQGNINVRMDYEHNEEVLIRTLVHRECTIIADKPIDLKYLLPYRKHVLNINFNIDNAFTEEYIDSIKRTGIRFSLGSYESDPEIITNLRLKFFDYDVDQYSHPIKKDFDPNLRIENDTYFKSNKFIFSKGKLYSSLLDWKSEKHKESFFDNESKAEDCEDFWKEAEHFRIITKNNNGNSR